MSHLRQQIREAIVTDLGTLSSPTLTVFDTPPRATPPNSFPAALVFSGDETIDYISKTLGTRTQERILTVSIDLQVEQNTGFAGQLDTIAVEIEIKFAGSRLGGLIKKMNLASISTATTGEGEKTIATAKLVYLVNYTIIENDPENPA